MGCAAVLISDFSGKSVGILGAGLSFVHAAFKELLECRSVLQHSYPFSFFRYESLALKRHRHGKRLWNEKTTFEQMQSELEMITEQMSDSRIPVWNRTLVLISCRYYLVEGRH